ncbi:glycoside hydrolase family 43 protein [Croceibacterium ferulae]|uniref:glycoside hydrolase family 43 protein n=1 Tax=Croceibacterium ferulae TaxID=1854641 RepID=UPI000EB37F02|nr:glycoside hydrolase family 43 protein [Croceibacterium ferulae]
MTMMTRRTAAAGLFGTAMLAGTGCAHAPRAGSAAGGFVFSYFTSGRGEADGLRLAISTDGLTYRAVRNGAVLLAPEVGERRLMRDPFLLRGPNAGDPWHLLWTTAWEGVTLGHATSHDLINWSPQRAIPVMAGVPGAMNVWAPEMIWDARAGHFMLFWSSTVTGRFPETAGTSEDAWNHRLYYATTRDFRDVSPPQLLFDPGFSVIDGTFHDHPTLGLHLIVKDETLVPEKKHLRIASAASPTGPFGELSAPFSPDWVEGPATVQIGEWTYVVYDRYREGSWGAARSRDLVRWEDASAAISMPPEARHGTIVRAPAALIAGLG